MAAWLPQLAAWLHPRRRGAFDAWHVVAEGSKKTFLGIKKNISGRKEGRKEGRNERTKEGTNERRNERTKERRNEGTKEGRREGRKEGSKEGRKAQRAELR